MIVTKRVDRCQECGGNLRWRTSNGTKPYQFSDYGFGLQVSNVSTAQCAKCRASYAVIPNAERFKDNVLEQILAKPSALTASEIVFLRKHMGLTGGIFAGLVGVSREHVSHIEQGHAPNLGTAADRLARIMISAKLDPSLRLLKKIMGGLDENIGTRSRRKQARQGPYKVNLGVRRAS